MIEPKEDWGKRLEEGKIERPGYKALIKNCRLEIRFRNILGPIPTQVDRERDTAGTQATNGGTTDRHILDTDTDIPIIGAFEGSCYVQFLRCSRSTSAFLISWVRLSCSLENGDRQWLDAAVVL